jgi:hypothetical protein
MSTSGLPKGRKLWRYTVTLETEGGDRKLFKSILLTEKEANDEYLELIRTGYKDASVIVDKDAAAAYDAERKTAKPSRGGSHG